jgi:hypothetical protein
LLVIDRLGHLTQYASEPLKTAFKEMEYDW